MRSWPRPRCRGPSWWPGTRTRGWPASPASGTASRPVWIALRTRGGAVAFVGDDPAAKSSTVPGASEFLLADLGMPVLYPADPQDIVDLGRHAVAMSRLSGLWVAGKIATNVADGAGTVEVGSDRVQPVLPEVRFEHTVNARMLPPALLEVEK